MRRVYFIAAVLIVFLYFAIGFSQYQIQENRAPIVKIVDPKDHSTFRWSSIIPYSIHVSDHEDGDSEYDEINSTEVLLVVKYLKDSSEIKSYLKKESKTDYAPLVQIGRSSCFSCHRAKGTLIGPSFERIAEKYQNDPKALEILTKNIIEGGTASWGDEKMPPNPNLKVAQVQEMVRWILENNSDTDKNYLSGIEGAIKTKEQAGSAHEKSVLVLTGLYTDHGSNNQPQNSKQAQNTITLKSN